MDNDNNFVGGGMLGVPSTPNIQKVKKTDTVGWFGLYDDKGQFIRNEREAGLPWVGATTCGRKVAYIGDPVPTMDSGDPMTNTLLNAAAKRQRQHRGWFHQIIRRLFNGR